MKHLPLLLAAALALPAWAVEYREFQPAKSRIDFVSKQMNVPVEGSFKRFTSTLAFDPEQPALGKATLEIDLASVDTGSTEADEEVVGKAWFNTKAFPKASFVSSSLKPLGGNRFELAGTLTIKGRSKQVVAPLSFRQEGGLGIFEGSFTLQRLDYGLGDGIWADFETVASEIQIRFRIAAAAAK